MTIVMSDIHVDIMSFIKPNYVNEAQFRSMWTEFEWEVGFFNLFCYRVGS